MADHTKAYRAYQDLVDNDMFSYVKSCSPEVLSQMFDLENGSADLLHILVEDHWAEGPHWDKYDPNLLQEALGEAEHQSYDGWSDSDKVVIMAFMADITKALRHMN